MFGVGDVPSLNQFGCLLVDDPVKDLAEAQSLERKALTYAWLRGALDACKKDASCVVSMTRWGTDDLAGRLIEDGWDYLNFPAVAETGVPDALGRREMGEGFPSARGRTVEDFVATRERLGDELFDSLYQGRPHAA